MRSSVQWSKEPSSNDRLTTRRRYEHALFPPDVSERSSGAKLVGEGRPWRTPPSHNDCNGWTADQLTRRSCRGRRLNTTKSGQRLPKVLEEARRSVSPESSRASPRPERHEVRRPHSRRTRSSTRNRASGGVLGGNGSGGLRAGGAVPPQRVGVGGFQPSGSELPQRETVAAISENAASATLGQKVSSETPVRFDVPPDPAPDLRLVLGQPPVDLRHK